MIRHIAGLMALVVVLLSVSPAYAHTPEEFDAWLAEWAEAVKEDGALTPEALEEWQDMRDKHHCLVEYCAPPVKTVKKRTYNTAGVEQWRPLVSTYFPAGAVEWALAIIKCESGGNPSAKNPSSSASGLFQHLAKYWPERSAKAGWAGADIFDPAANIAVAAWLWSTGGPGHWVCKA